MHDFNSKSLFYHFTAILYFQNKQATQLGRKPRNVFRRTLKVGARNSPVRILTDKHLLPFLSVCLLYRNWFTQRPAYDYTVRSESRCVLIKVVGSLEVMSTSVYKGLPRLILFANTFCRSAREMFIMNAVIAVFNSLSVRGRSRYTAS